MTADDGFLGFGSEDGSSSDESSQEPCSRSRSRSRGLAASPTPLLPLALDRTASDVLLEQVENGVLRRALLDELPPEIWALGRADVCIRDGEDPGVLIFRAEIQRLDGVGPSLLFGWLAVPAGAPALPLPPVLMGGSPCCHFGAIDDEGFEVFTSRAPGSAGQLLRAPLTRRLHAGDTVEAALDVSRRRLTFRVQGQELLARRAPVEPLGSGVQYIPFLALRGGAQLRNLQGPASVESSESRSEALVLAGPPGAGKTTWAAEYARRRRPATLHVLGAEYLQSRREFLESVKADPFARASDTAEAPAADIKTDASSAPSDLLPVKAEVDASRLLKELASREISSEDFEDAMADLDTDMGDVGFMLEFYHERDTIDVEDDCQPEVKVKEPEEDPDRALTWKDVEAAVELSLPDARLLPEILEAWPLRQYRELLIRVMPKLLAQAAARGASFIADDCHLDSTKFTLLRKALAGQWHRRVAPQLKIVLPPSFEELERRRRRRGPDLRALDARATAALPRAGAWPVEFVGGGVAIFDAYIDSAGFAKPPRRSQRAEDAPPSQSAFFDEQCGQTPLWMAVSTEGRWS